MTVSLVFVKVDNVALQDMSQVGPNPSGQSSSSRVSTASMCMQGAPPPSAFGLPVLPHV